MPDGGAVLLAKIGADASQYRTELRQSSQETNAFAGEMRNSLASVNSLTERITFQERELEGLQSRLTAAKDPTVAYAAETQKAEGNVARLTERIASQTQQLDQLNNKLTAARDPANAFGAEMDKAQQNVAKFLTQIQQQEQDLGLLEQRLQKSIQTKGADAEATQRLQVQADRLTLSLRGNEQALQAEQARIAEIAGRKSVDTAETQKLEAQIAKLTASLGSNQTALAADQARLAEIAQIKTVDTAETQRLQLQVDKLSSSINTNQTALQNEKQNLADLANEAARANPIMDALGQVGVGALRKLGEIGVDAVTSGIRQLTDVTKDFIQTGIESYGTNERISQSYQSLIAVELQRSNSALSQADALEQARGRAEELVKWNQQLAVNSPFSEEEAAKATRTALAYGFTSEQAQRLTQVITDTTAATGQTGDALGRIELALGQIQARGKTTAQEFNQLSEAGINARQILADAFGTTTKNIEDMNEKGQLTADKVIPAIVDRLDKDFGGAAARQANGVQGLGNSLQDLYAIAARDVLGPTIEAALPSVRNLVTLLQDPKTKAELQAIGKEIGSVAADAIPKLVQGTRDLIGGFTDAYATAKPVIDLLGGGVGIIEGLGAAYAVTLLPGIINTTKALVEQGPAALKMYGPGGAWALAAISIGAAVSAYKGFNDQVERQAGKSVDVVSPETVKALDDFSKLTEDQRKQAQPQVDEIIAQRKRLQDFLADSAKSEADAFFESDKEEIRQRRADAIKASEISLNAYVAALHGKIDADVQDAQNTENYNRLEANRLKGITTTTAALQEQLTTVEKLDAKDRDKLGKSAEKVDASEGNLTQAQAAYQLAETQRLDQHNEKLRQIDSKAGVDRLAAQKVFDTASIAAKNEYENAYDAIQDAFEQKQQQRDHTEGERHLASEKTLNDALLKIQSDRNSQQGSYDHEREEARQANADKLTEIAYQESERQADAARDLNDKLADVESKRTEIVTEAQQQRVQADSEYQQRLVDAQEAYQSKEAETIYQFNQKIIDAERGYNDQLADLDDERARARDKFNDDTFERETSLQNKLQDLRENAQYKKEDLSINYGDDREDAAISHQEKLQDLQEKIAGLTDSRQLEGVQKEIAQENERFQRQEARAQRDYERKQEQAARELARQEEQAQQEEQRAQERAQRDYDQTTGNLNRKREALEGDYNERVAKLIEQNNHERELQQLAYAQQLVDLGTKHTNELQAIDSKAEIELGKLNEQAQHERDQYTQREADAAEHLRHTLEGVQQGYKDQLDALDYKNSQEKIKLDQAVTDANAAYGNREKAAKDTYDYETGQQQIAFEKQEQDAGVAYNKKLTDLQTHLKDQSDTIDLQITTQRQAEDAAYLASETAAQTSYGNQRKALLDAYGQAQQDFIAQEQSLSLISAAEGTRRARITAIQTGVDPERAANDYINQVNAMFTSRGQAVNASGGIQIGSITMNGVNDPVELFRQIQEEGAREAQRNGYSTIGGKIGG